MNDNIITGKWNEFKGEVQQLWGKVTGDDLDRTQGNVKAIGGLLEQKYGELKEEAKTKFNELLAKYKGEAAPETHSEAKIHGIADKIANKSEEIKENVKVAFDKDKNAPTRH